MLNYSFLSQALPSSKRQRVSVSTMERLFAACSMGGGRARGDGAGGHYQARDGTGTGGHNDSTTRQEEIRQRGKKAGPTRSTGAINSSDTNQEAQSKGEEEEEVGREQSSSPSVLSPLETRTNLVPKSEEVNATHLTSPKNNDGDNDSPPTTDHEVDSSPADNDGKGMTALSNSSSEDNNSNEEVGKGSGQKIAEWSTSASVKQIAVSKGKRSAEEEEEETRGVQHNSEDVVQHTSKRVRKLKRGLRLCSNITCYIEQVLYNC